MKILVFNVKYSENLGDGILALCLEKALAENAANVVVETIDLAGRQAFGAVRGSRNYALRILHVLPAFARRLAVECALGRSIGKLRHEWERKIAGADAIVIGGGNLFQDDDLNFPLKVGTVLDCVRASNRPLAIYAVGVSGDWSAGARRLFSRWRGAHLVHVSVRDTLACGNWRRHFPDGPQVEVLPDPGLLAAELAVAGQRTGLESSGPLIGICATEPVILSRHAGRPAAAIPFRKVEDYRELIRLLTGDGYRVCLFCNGAREDQAFAERILADGGMTAMVTADVLSLAERPRMPQDLIRILASMRVILAHRLHACIAAYSLGIPHVGLGWDKKVEAFFQAVGRSAYFADADTALPRQIAFLLAAAERNGIDPALHVTKLTEARAAILSMRECLLRAGPSEAMEGCA